LFVFCLFFVCFLFVFCLFLHLYFIITQKELTLIITKNFFFLWWVVYVKTTTYTTYHKKTILINYFTTFRFSRNLENVIIIALFVMFFSFSFLPLFGKFYVKLTRILGGWVNTILLLFLLKILLISQIYC